MNESDYNVTCRTCQFYDCSMTRMGYCDLHQCFEETDHTCKDAKKADDAVISLRNTRFYVVNP